MQYLNVPVSGNFEAEKCKQIRHVVISDPPSRLSSLLRICSLERKKDQWQWISCIA